MLTFPSTLPSLMEPSPSRSETFSVRRRYYSKTLILIVSFVISTFILHLRLLLSYLRICYLICGSDYLFDLNPRVRSNLNVACSDCLEKESMRIVIVYGLFPCYNQNIIDVDVS